MHATHAWRAGFVPYYIVRGAYSLEQLRSRSSSNHLTTMFDTGSITCTDPSDKESTAPSDGDIKVPPRPLNHPPIPYLEAVASHTIMHHCLGSAPSHRGRSVGADAFNG